MSIINQNLCDRIITCINLLRFPYKVIKENDVTNILTCATTKTKTDYDYDMFVIGLHTVIKNIKIFDMGDGWDKSCISLLDFGDKRLTLLYHIVLKFS